MIRVRITFIVFQEGQPEEQVQTITDFQDIEELANEMARLAAHNSTVFTHTMIRDIARPSKITARVRTPKGIRTGTSIIVKAVELLSITVPPELERDPEMLYHAAAAHLAARKNLVN